MPAQTESDGVTKVVTLGVTAPETVTVTVWVDVPHDEVPVTV